MENDLTASPLVSVIIPAFNVGPYIAATIQSVLNQTYRNIELIIINDGSVDDTAARVKPFISDRLILIEQANAGAATARNQGYWRAKGDFIKFLDGDDIINTEMIAGQLKLALENSGCIISGKWGRFYQNDIRTFRLAPENCWQTLPAVEWICCAWRNARPMTQPGIFLLPKKVAQNAGPWDETLSLLDDTEYFMRVILNSKKVVFCAAARLYYRSGNANNLSGRSTRSGFESAFSAIDKAMSALLTITDSADAKLACANNWQSFIYWIYPFHPDLAAAAMQKIKLYGHPDLQFESGGYGKVVQRFVGWKLLKKFKLWLRR